MTLSCICYIGNKNFVYGRQRHLLIVTIEMRRSFICSWLDRKQKMSDLCRQFKIARKTGYQWIRRYESEGWEGLGNKNSAPRCRPGTIDLNLRSALADLISANPGFGARRLRSLLAQRVAGQKIPSLSTIAKYLKAARASKVDSTMILQTPDSSSTATIQNETA